MVLGDSRRSTRPFRQRDSSNLINRKKSAQGRREGVDQQGWTEDGLKFH